ncbi:MAG: glycosyltransferase, partial [Oscillospiraceae bacterium]|nr:glycosyltransferase [Oscillospiraceae bacterium]
MTRKILIAAMALDIGGAETHIATLVRELRRRGNDVLVVSAGGVYAAEIEACGAKHITAPLNRRSLPAMLRGLLILRREMRRFRPNIVHAHARIPAFLCGILKKLGGKFAFVTTAHGVFEVTRATRLLSDWGSRTLAVSDDVREYLTANYDLPPDDIRLTVNGIDTERFSPDTDGSAVRRELGIPPDAPVALTVSRLDESAGDPAAKLAEAAPELSRAIPGLRVVIAGGGVLDSAREARLRLRVPELNALCGYDCVILAGARDDIPELLAAADVFVGVSRAALEALAAGKPVILAGGQGCGGVLDETSLPDALATNFTFRGTPLAETEDLVRDVSELWNGSGFTNRAGFGRALVLERYSVTRTADDAEAAYGEAAAAGVSAAMCGYYGYGNAGDDEIMRCVRRAAYDAGMRKITVLSRAPRSTEREFGFRARSRFNPFSLFWTLLRSDLLIFGGGSLLQDATSTRSLVYYCSVLRLARLCGAKTVIYANGVGPLTREANRRRVLREVSRAAVVTLRDKASEAELISLGVAPEKLTVTADPAFADAPRQSA